jgi:cobalt-zinc-cadmium efflux system protein
VPIRRYGSDCDSTPPAERLLVFESVTHDTRLALVLALNLALVASLVVVGVRAHSLGVFAEGVDYIADAGAIIVSLLAIRLARVPPSAKWPQGYPKATTIAAFVNAGWMLVLSVAVAASAVRRFSIGTPHVHGLPVLIVSGIAAVVMVFGALILRGDGHDRDLNLRAVLLDTVGDAAAAAGVAITGGVILLAHGVFWLDPVVAFGISLVVGYHATRLLREVLRRSALQRTDGTPTDVAQRRRSGSR